MTIPIFPCAVSASWEKKLPPYSSFFSALMKTNGTSLKFYTVWNFVILEDKCLGSTESGLLLRQTLFESVRCYFTGQNYGHVTEGRPVACVETVVCIVVIASLLSDFAKI